MLWSSHIVPHLISLLSEFLDFSPGFYGSWFSVITSRLFVSRLLMLNMTISGIG